MGIRRSTALVRPLALAALVALPGGLLGSTGLAGAATAPTSLSGIDLVVPTGHRMSGTVLSVDGDKVRYTTVNACPTEESRQWQCTYGQVDSGGAFDLAGIPDGDYRLKVFRPSDSDLVGGYYGPGGYAATQEAATAVHLGPGDATGIVIKLPHGLYTISGTITERTAAGTTTVSGAGASACEVGGSGECAYGSAAADGTYAIRGLMAGTYQVQFSPPWNTGWLSVWAGPSGGVVARDKAVSFTVDPDHTAVSGVDAALPLGRKLSGQLLDTKGNPLINAYVYACGGDGACPSANADEEGSFTIKGMASGRAYTVYYGAPAGDVASGIYGPAGFVPSWGPNARITMGSKDVTLPALRAPAGTLHMSGTITGSDGKPLANAWLSACAPSDPTSGWANACANGQTKADGTYAMTLLMAGTYTLQVGAQQGDNYQRGYRAADGSFVRDQPASGGLSLGTPISPTITRRVPGISATKVAKSTAVAIRFAAPVSGASTQAIRLRDDTTLRELAATVTYDPRSRTATLRPKAALVPGRHYTVMIERLWSATYNTLPAASWGFTVRK